MIDFLLETFAANREREAIVWRDVPATYGWLLESVREWQRRLDGEGLPSSAVVAVEADFSPNAVALFLALASRGDVVVPLTSSVAAKRETFLETAGVEAVVSIDAADEGRTARRSPGPEHPLYRRLRESGHPGLVLFSSGSTGESKAALHDLSGILEKFRTPRHARRTISFLLYDHIGGVNTMLYTLSNAGCLVTVADRSPDAVLAAVERHRVELLPTSPTFLNLMLLSGAAERHDLSTLQTITYGTEPMPQSTLERLHELLPSVTLLQTYGLSEVGILRSKSKSSDSLWVKIGGEGFETRVVDGALQIRARSAMLGYLNAPSPFTEDGWLATGDAVETDGEYVRILGRRSEIINVGGEKVYPAEVESVIQKVDNVAAVTVRGERNPITGQIVCARVTPVLPEDPKELALRVKAFCRERLAPFQVPVKVQVTADRQYSDRFKKTRRIDA
jgi:acyl-coenzyme A synthetase/AMP-(fatty) acid ligase